ncbi:hypothetical protein [Ferrimonas pelagia]|uniref:DUF560 domain-containing protein n=1 Tax=Ferrimonas pelagia TaxID=1177826 RepID=A0ABP9FF61_9GAMM
MLLCVLLSTALLAGDEPSQPVDPSPAIDEPVEATSLRWFDKAHRLLSISGQASAQWFDGFFGPSDAADSADAWLRLRLQQQLFERDSNQFKARLSASFHLPQTKRRLKLLVESDPDGDLTDLRDLSDSSANSSTRAALRWTPWDYQTWDLSFDAGITLDSGLDPFIRSRARHFYAWDERTVIRLSQEVKGEAQDGWSETTRVVWERLFDDHGYRFSSRAKFGEQSAGLEWNVSLLRGFKLSDVSGIGVFYTVSGATRDQEDQSEIHRLGLNYRRNFLRSWLFYELEPQLTWPRKYQYQTNWELRLTLEAQFGQRR